MLSSFYNLLLFYTSVQVAILLRFLLDSSLMSSPKSSSLFENQTSPFKAVVSQLFFFLKRTGRLSLLPLPKVEELRDKQIVP